MGSFETEQIRTECNQDQSLRLTLRELYELDLNGFIVIKNFLSQNQVQYMNSVLDQAQKDQHILYFPFLELDPAFLDLLSHPRSMSICKELLGQQFRLDHAYGIQRGPFELSAQGENLHAGPMANQGSYQYSFYNGYPRPTFLVFAYCLEPQKEGDGGLVIVPGSHKQSMPLEGAQVYRDILKEDLSAWWVHQPVLEPGDLLLFYETVVHGTRKWISKARRRRNLYYKYAAGFIAWREYSQIERYKDLARNELERNLFRPPYVARYDENELPRWANLWKEPTCVNNDTRTYEHVICRIIGNEMVPRDEPGSRLKVLKYIIDHEPKFASTKRIWILNQINDPEYLAEVKKILVENNEHYHELQFSLKRYLTSWNQDERVCSAINVNSARNQTFSIGRKIGRFVHILDGDCFFTDDAWAKTTSAIAADQVNQPQRKYYSVPMRRIRVDDISSADSVPEGEPQLIFRQDADLYFDENIPFGKNDKAELLRRLGHESVQSDNWIVREQAHLCASAGYILHLNTGSVAVERDLSLRMTSRQKSVEDFLKQVESRILTKGSTKERTFLLMHRILRTNPRIASKITGAALKSR